MKDKLQAAVGHHVRLQQNVDDTAESPARLQLHVCGKLTYTPDNTEYCVRINDDPQGHGFNYVSFWESNVESVYRQPGGITEITLKSQ